MAISLYVLLSWPAFCQTYQFTKVLDQATQRPDGQGVFVINLGQSTPAFDGTWVVFRDPGLLNDDYSKSAIWSYRVQDKKFVKLVDWSTVVPASGATFRDFRTLDTAPAVRNGVAVFVARDTAAQQGIYSVPAGGGAVQAIADNNSPNPSGGNFTVIDSAGKQMGGFTFDGSTAVFKASGSQSTSGLYSALADGTSLQIVADGAHPAHGGAVRDFSAPAVSGANIVLIGKDGSPSGTGFSGIYLGTPGGNGTLTELVGSATPLPGNTNPNFHTTIDSPVIAMDGNLVVFHATDSNAVATGGLTGLYSYDLSSMTIGTVADRSTVIAGQGQLRGVGFSGVAVNQGSVLFLASDSSGRSSLYIKKGAVITRVIGTGDTLDGRVIQALNEPGPSALNGGSFAFIADFGRDRGLFVAMQTAPDLSFAGSITHLASGGNWSSTITAVNTGAAANGVRFDFFANDGSPLTLPLELPQTPGGSISTSSAFNRILGAGELLVVTSQAPGDLLVGSGQVSTSGGIGGFSMFRDNLSGQEAAVPWESRNARIQYLPFDNTGGLGTGVAVANSGGQAATVPIIFRDDAGATIGSASLDVPARGHVSFDLSTSYPGTAGKVGTASFETPVGGRISALGLRFSPTGNGGSALTTIPVLAEVAGGTGSLAQVACGAGWQTTFVLVNTGTVAGQATLQFFDNQGLPLALPLAYPQSGRTASSSSINETVLAGGTLIVVAQEASSLLVGSAQLVTSSGVAGFGMFRFNPSGQEAVVPLENRVASTYVLPFDNTGGVGTGVAVANLSGQQANIAVTFRDDTGASLTTGTIVLSALGHDSFELFRAYPVTSGKRGTVEFTAPSAGRISVLGLRTSPTGVGGNFSVTTLPVLAK